MKNESPAKTAPKPTPTELSILGILWERGPSTVREVHEVLSKSKPIGYTGVLKFLQIMTAKGSVRRNSDQRAHVYEPVQHENNSKRQLVDDLMQAAFSGSASALVMHALAGQRTSQEEIDEIRRILDAHERKSK